MPHNVQQIHTPVTSLTTSLSIYSLNAAYNPLSPTFATIGPNANPANATLLDIEALTTNGTGAVTFTIPDATIDSWAGSRSTNYGLVLVESSTWSDNAGHIHSDIRFYASGALAPSLSFEVPEPAFMALLGVGMPGLAVKRRRSR